MKMLLGQDVDDVKWVQSHRDLYICDICIAHIFYRPIYKDNIFCVPTSTTSSFSHTVFRCDFFPFGWCAVPFACVVSNQNPVKLHEITKRVPKEKEKKNTDVYGHHKPKIYHLLRRIILCKTITTHDWRTYDWGWNEFKLKNHMDINFHCK